MSTFSAGSGLQHPYHAEKELIYFEVGLVVKNPGDNEEISIFVILVLVLIIKAFNNRTCIDTRRLYGF